MQEVNPPSCIFHRASTSASSSKHASRMISSGNVLCPVSNNLDPSLSHGLSEALAVDQRRLRGLFLVPMNIGGDELQPCHSSIRIQVEDDTRWIIAKEILGVGLGK
jgi:hypothetical protein